MDLVQQEFWDKSYENFDNGTQIPSTSPLISWIDEISSLAINGTCIEIGAFPGGYSNEFGKLGHIISGVDLTPRITELNKTFNNRNYKVGEFKEQNFLDFTPENKYDIVFSVGFIEHFNDYLSIIEKHCDLVNDNGVLFIAVPNFRGKIQYLLHKLMDKDNLAIHNINSMNPDEWEETIRSKGFEIVKKGYIGGFDFWTGSTKKNYLQIAARRLMVFVVNPLLKKILTSPSSSYSPYCGIIAKRNKV
ncbi:2-polyprenyl-3-methyl-5-hydroxy-6-metoxy-1,4-benzoquinol methylase [Dysgonomonadaceae bacterium PH5-43]|nr:2-polyprenyl-3-methyl-5-hydroxy-6-metoxy-1,4-benzoquinol methylase [Dysgonomonadaceae bacterium PH5-43]